MNRSILAIVFQEGGRFLSEFLKTRPSKPRETHSESPLILKEFPQETSPEKLSTDEEKATSIEAGCVPCAIGHLGTCTGLLNESMRFARSDGIQSVEVIDRMNHCLDELNAMEREDLTPEKIANLPSWEKNLAIEALKASRSARHSLEGISHVDELEKVAAETQTTRTQIGREWFKQKLQMMPPEQKTKIAEKAIEKLEKEG